MSDEGRPGFYPKIRDVRIDDALASDLARLVSLLQPHLHWREFGRVPWQSVSAGGIRFYRDLLTILPAGRYAFLRESPTHTYMFERLVRRVGAQAAMLFRLLCLNDTVDESALAGLLPSHEIDRFVSQRVLLRSDRKLTLPVTFIPYGDYYYVAESRHVMEDPDGYGIRPAHLSLQTQIQITCFRRILRAGRRVPRLLEMGSGIGIVTLELADLAESREGAELYQRNLDFAAINKSLRNDRSVGFYQSDLFAHVTGMFDIVIFAPWQPSEDFLDLIRRFLEEVPAYLTPDGTVLLWISSRGVDGRDVVVDEVASILRRQQMHATRYTVLSYFNRERAGAVGYLSCLRIESNVGRRPRNNGAVVRAYKDIRYAEWKARTIYARMGWAGRDRRAGAPQP